MRYIDNNKLEVGNKHLIKAAKKLAEQFNYPWDYMPDEGRENMQKIVIAIIETFPQEW